MSLHPKTILPVLLAILILTVTVNRTMSALKSSGSWQTARRTAHARSEDPYARLERALSRPLLQPPADHLRDPFVFAPLHAPGPPRPVVARPVVPPPPPKPVLTSIIWDNDPRATIRYEDHDYSVRENSLFADFKVTSITATQVVLDRSGEPVVLTLRSKGE